MAIKPISALKSKAFQSNFKVAKMAIVAVYLKLVAHIIIQGGSTFHYNEHFFSTEILF